MRWLLIFFLCIALSHCRAWHAPQILKKDDYLNTAQGEPLRIPKTVAHVETLSPSYQVPALHGVATANTPDLLTPPR